MSGARRTTQNAGFLCRTCGLQYAPGDAPPARCVVCEDDRQFVPKAGQQWTTPDELAREHANLYREVAPGLLGIATTPPFGIGQRALLARTPAGNVLWDCLSLLDSATLEIVRGLGGLKAVALSHPHFYSAMASWGRAFGCPVLVHEADRDWVVERDACIEFWQGEAQDVLPGVTLHRLGGHFPGSSVLHWADRRTLLAGDTMLVTQDRRHVAFMWSYPNYVPLPSAEVERIGRRLAELDFDAIHGPFWERDIDRGARAAVERSIARQLRGGAG